MRRAVPVQFTTGLLLVTQLCSAQPAESPPFTLSYRAPAVCPSENAFRADVASHVHDESRGMGARLELSIEKETSGYRGLLIASDASGAQGSRHIEGSTCPE